MFAVSVSSFLHKYCVMCPYSNLYLYLYPYFLAQSRRWVHDWCPLKLWFELYIQNKESDKK